MAKATRVHSTPRRTGSKIQTMERPELKRQVLGRSRRASLARAKQIVELLSACYVREGWKIDEAAAKQALAYCQAYAKDGSDPDEGRRVAMDFFHSHGQSLDWVFCGDIGGGVCRVAQDSVRATER